ncbi:MAG: heme lyase CcmF/NrfE family subunit [Thermoleophilaceae bacterium]
MITLGRACLLLALVIAPAGAAASIYGARAGRSDWVAVGRRSVYALFGVVSVSFVVLEAAFLRSDFSFKVVTTHSSTTTPTFYRAAAMWSSQEGSLLLWVWLLSGWSSLILFATRKRLREIAPWATAVLLGFAAFFIGLSVFLANPFQVLDPAPAEGVGLEPLLRFPTMMIHPPMLYSGYTLATVPFAFAIGALITRRTGPEWLRATRRFSLAAWLCLGFGILLGARWSWSELGWGGYWAWDPVENAALMPWLTGTALLHSTMVQEKRGMLKAWNVGLTLATGILAVLGTFLVRSGVLQSIHAFGASTLGKPFLVFVALLVVGSIVLVVSRLDYLQAESKLDSLLSRESLFLVNNLLLVGLCFVIFWGTFFPLISEAVSGSKDAVGPPWFDRYTVPLAIGVVLLSGIGPLVAWRRATLASVRRSLLVPTVFAVTVAVTLVPVGGGSPRALAIVAAGAFAVATVAQELWRGTRARRAMTGAGYPRALFSLVGRNRRRYGGYLVHLGIAVLLVGVAVSSSFQHIRETRLGVGQSARVGGYTMRYVKPTASVSGAKVSLGAVMDVSKRGRHVTTLRPSRDYFPSVAQGVGPAGRYFDGESTSAVALRSGPTRDLWTAIQPDLSPLQASIARADRTFANAPASAQALVVGALAARYQSDPPPAVFRLIVSPLVVWVWIGGMVAVAGALVALWPSPEYARRRVLAFYAARLGRELGRA